MTGGAILQVFPGGGAILQVIPYQIDIEQIRAVEGRKHRYLNPILTKGKGTPRGADSAHHPVVTSLYVCMIDVCSHLAG